MKIAQINISDLYGGAAKACYRLHLGLIKHNIESRLFVMNKLSDDPTVIGLKNGRLLNRFQEKIDKIPLKLYPNKSPFFFSNGWLSLNKLFPKVFDYKPDIIHLHWVGNSIIQISELENFTNPIIWSLHDMWAFTGGCHNNNGCTKYSDQCGKCPVLNSKHNYDLSRKNLRIKKKYYDKKNNLSIVGLSKWIANSARSSSLLKNIPVYHLPNFLDTSIYKNLEDSKNDNKWNLPKNKLKILCASVNPQNTFVKGYKFLDKLIKSITFSIDCILIFIGKSADYKFFGNNIYFIEPITDEMDMVYLYNLVDLVIHPSIQENLSNVIMESMACGTPVVAFNVGGNSDLIEHKINGYLAASFDEDDLMEGINWIRKNNTNKAVSINAREKIIKNFSEKINISKYIKLYEKAILKK